MTNEELEFLPAALEIQETPPLPMARHILRAIMLFFGIAVVWASIGEVDIVSVAQGKIVPSGRVKVIQPLETGVIRQIHVREGQHVTEGDILIELDTTLVGADRERIREQQLVLKLDRARLLTLLSSIDQKQVTSNKRPMTNDDFSSPMDASPAQIHLQKNRLQTQLNEYHARNEALLDEMRQRRAERGAVRNRIEQLDATLPLITERAKSLADLENKNLAPRVQWLELEQERIEQVMERKVQRNNEAMIDAAIANIRQRITAQRAEFETQLLSDLADVETRITAFDQELVKAEQRLMSQQLTAPVTGKVHQLAIHTIGGVVTPAQELMRIVPDEDTMEIESWLPNKDIGFVHEGQAAEIKVETFPFTRYGTINGKVNSLSSDAIADERLGLVYATRVRMLETTMKVQDRIVSLTPGMAVTVEMNLGKRRLIEFLLSPLLTYRDESVRER